MRVQDIIKAKGSSQIISVREDTTIQEAAQIMRRRNVGALIVMAHESKFRGVLSERDVVSVVARCGKRALELHVCEAMIDKAPVISPADSMTTAMEMMTQSRSRHLPVVMNETVVGLISIGDVVKARLSEKITENLVLQEIANWPRIAVG